MGVGVGAGGGADATGSGLSELPPPEQPATRIIRATSANLVDFGRVNGPDY
jgi:hypothetical protein